MNGTSQFLVAFILSAAMLAPVPSFAGSWMTREMANGFEAYTPNQQGQSALVLSCTKGKPVTLRIFSPLASGWKANLPASITVDTASFPMRVEGGEDSVLLNSGQDESIGIDGALLTALKTGKTMMLDGPATAAMSEAGKTFALAGSQAAIDMMELHCGLAVSNVVHAPGNTSDSLPLREGEYTVGDCGGKLPAGAPTIGIYKLTDGPQAGQQFITRPAEEGFCYIKQVSVDGTLYSGAATCDSGTRILTDLGTYHFSYTILGSDSFTSEGKHYNWCTHHR